MTALLEYSGLLKCHDVSNVTRSLNLRRTLLPPPSEVQQKSLLLLPAQILKLEAGRFSESSVTTYQLTRCNIPKDLALKIKISPV